MKRILVISAILAAMLLGACAAPVTTPEPTTTPTLTPTPAETILTPTPTPTYTLSVSVSPSEAGSVSPPSGKYESGLQVTLSATSASGYTFDYWDGAASGSSHTVTITMNSNKSTTAHFKAVETPAQQAELPVIKNTDAAKLALTLNDVQSDGFVLQDEARPTEPDSISAYFVKFTREDDKLSNSIAIYPSIQTAERHYGDLEFNSKDTIVRTVTVGDKGFISAMESPEPDPPRYTILFRKNNVVVTIWGLTDIDKTEVYARIVEAKIQ